MHTWACGEVVQECIRLEDTLLTLGMLQLRFRLPWLSIPNTRRSTSLLKTLRGCFPRLHESGLLEIQVPTGTSGMHNECPHYLPIYRLRGICAAP